MRNTKDTYKTTVASTLKRYDDMFKKQALYLRIIYPESQCKCYELQDKPLTIGRGNDADIKLNDDLISRNHCKVSILNDQLIVEDLGSTNGTLIDGKTISCQVLKFDERLQVGPYVMKIEHKDPHEVQFEKNLFTAATTDGLTGLLNRRCFNERSLQQLENCSSEQQQFSLVMLDIDHFKQINDCYGHPAGDKVIKSIAGMLNNNKRCNDLIGRYGGEEFIMMLPQTCSKEAAAFCERIRSNIENLSIRYEEHHIRVTVSIGIISLTSSTEKNMETLIEMSDHCLYQAKNQGRNRIIQNMTQD